MSKNDVELLMFKFYIENLIEENKNNDDTIDYSKISDYKIAKELGITPQRVRNLKLKKELVYPQKDFNWKNSLRLLLENENSIKIENGYIKINIPDPNLFLAIQDSIEDNGNFVDIHLNSKILSVHKDSFMTLIELIDENEECVQLEKNIEKQYKNTVGGDCSKFSKALMVSEIIANTAGAAADIASIFSIKGKLGKAAINILKKIIEECK